MGPNHNNQPKPLGLFPSSPAMKALNVWIELSGVHVSPAHGGYSIGVQRRECQMARDGQRWCACNAAGA